MHDIVETARLLDILGNRNRRRIIELLRQKPCFVTEISDTLMLSPKAVIEHLQMMEREAILACQTDERRRKYYYLANDILVEVSLKHGGTGQEISINGQPIVADESRAIAEEAERHAARKVVQEQSERLKSSVEMLARMIRAHDRLADSLDQLNHDIETKITDIARNHNDIFRNERELSVIIALCHESLTAEELQHVTGNTGDMLASLLRRLERRGIVERKEGRYQLQGVYAE
ncbi:MAG: Helix-turn-helix domain protein [Methanoregula sp. PtaU1.Bin051]|nr:MAG: Helix-turn-helix domain protein [Methanoregula sp. PtaU1.Bin051]